MSLDQYIKMQFNHYEQAANKWSLENRNPVVGGYDKHNNWEDYVNLDHIRPGQDVRYSLDDTKLRSLGWKPEKIFDTEIERIVKFYKNNSRWFN